MKNNSKDFFEAAEYNTDSLKLLFDKAEKNIINKVLHKDGRDLFIAATKNTASLEFLLDKAKEYNINTDKILQEQHNLVLYLAGAFNTASLKLLLNNAEKYNIDVKTVLQQYWYFLFHTENTDSLTFLFDKAKEYDISVKTILQANNYNIFHTTGENAESVKFLFGKAKECNLSVKEILQANHYKIFHNAAKQDLESLKLLFGKAKECNLSVKEILQANHYKIFHTAAYYNTDSLIFLFNKAIPDVGPDIIDVKKFLEANGCDLFAATATNSQSLKFLFSKAKQYEINVNAILLVDRYNIFYKAAGYDTESLKFLFDQANKYELNVKEILQENNHKIFYTAAERNLESLKFLFDKADQYEINVNAVLLVEPYNIFYTAAERNLKSLKFLFDKADQYEINVNAVLLVEPYKIFDIAAHYNTDSLKFLFDKADQYKINVKEILQANHYNIFSEVARYDTEFLKFLFDKADQYEIDFNKILQVNNYRVLDAALLYEIELFEVLSNEKISKINDTTALSKILNSYNKAKDLHNFNKLLQLVENKIALEALNIFKTDNKNLSEDIAVLIVAYENQNSKISYDKIKSELENISKSNFIDKILDKVLATIQYNEIFKEEILKNIKLNELVSISKSGFMEGKLYISSSNKDICNNNLKAIIMSYILKSNCAMNTSEIQKIFEKMKQFALKDHTNHDKKVVEYEYLKTSTYIAESNFTSRKPNPGNDMHSNNIEINYTEDLAELDNIGFWEQSINYGEVWKTSTYLAENLKFINDLSSKIAEFITGEENYKFADVETVKNTSTLLHISSSILNAYTSKSAYPIFHTVYYTANNHLDIKEKLLKYGNDNELALKTIDVIECLIGAGVQGFGSVIFFGFTGFGIVMGAIPFAQCLIANHLLNDKSEALINFNYIINTISNITGIAYGNKVMQALEGLKLVHNTYCSYFADNQLTDNASSDNQYPETDYDTAEILQNHTENVIALDS